MLAGISSCRPGRVAALRLRKLEQAHVMSNCRSGQRSSRYLRDLRWTFAGARA